MAVKGPKKRGYKKPDPVKAQEERDGYAVRLWRTKVIDGLSYPQIAENEGVCVGTAFNLVTEGAKVMARFRRAGNQESDLVTALERIDYLYHTSKQWYDKGNAKHGAIMASAQRMFNMVTGLEKFEIRHNTALQAPDVLDRVKQIQGKVISPLVAEVMPQLPAAA